MTSKPSDSNWQDKVDDDGWFVWHSRWGSTHPDLSIDGMPIRVWSFGDDVRLSYCALEGDAEPPVQVEAQVEVQVEVDGEWETVPLRWYRNFDLAGMVEGWPPEGYVSGFWGWDFDPFDFDGRRWRCRALP